MSLDCLFCRIAAGELPATVVHQTDAVLAFRDLNPVAPTHVLIIPKAHYVNAAALAEADAALAGELLRIGGEIARAEGIADSGYRLVFNTGAGAGQSVLHVHLHLIGGRSLAWPPG